MLIAREPLSALPVNELPEKLHAQRINEGTKKILDLVRAHHDRSLMNDERAEAIARGVRRV